MTKAMDDLLEFAQIKLQMDFNRCSELYFYEKEPQVAKFVQAVWEWQRDRQKSQMVWEIFHNAFNTDELNFFAGLASFVGNCLLDDDRFVVKWFEWDFEEYEKSGDMKPKASTKENPKSWPEVFWAPDQTGEHDPNILLEIMNIHESRTNKRMQEIKESLDYE